MSSEKNKLSLKSKVIVTFVLLIVALILSLLIYVGIQLVQNNDDSYQVLVHANLNDMVKIDELSSFTAVYNGVAEVKNDKKPENTDYFVAYKSKVGAKIDFNKIYVDEDTENKVMTVTLPPIRIPDPDVDFASMDFLFYNDKINKSSISEKAYKICIEDAKKNCKNNKSILELSQKNIESSVLKLTEPYFKAFYPDYEINIVTEGR